MKVSVNENGTIELREVFNPIKLVSEANEELLVTMRDSGFEICYQGVFYSLKQNVLLEMVHIKNVKSNKDNLEELTAVDGFYFANDKTATFQIPSEKQ